MIWGGYAGKIRVLCMAGVLLVSAVAYHMMPQLKLCFSNRNLKKSRERCMVTVRLCVLTAIPCMVFLLICAPALTAASAEEGAGAITAGLLRIGSLCLIFYGIAAAFGIVLYSMEMMKILVLDMAVSAVLHLIVLYGMLHFLDLNAYGLVYANIIFSVLLSFCFLASVKRQLRLRINWLRMFLAPAVGGLVMAAVCAMLSNVLLKNAPALVNAIVSAAAGFLVYPLTIIVIKGISPKEMRALPAGERLLSMVRRFRLM